MSTTFHQAIAAIEAGNKAEGRRLLAEIIKSDPNNEYAWLWMSRAVEHDENRQRCLEYILGVNPNSQVARQELKLIGAEAAIPPPIKTPSRSIWTGSTMRTFAIIFSGLSLCIGPLLFLCAFTVTGINPVSIGVGIIASIIGMIVPASLFLVMVSNNPHESARTLRTVFRLFRLLR